MSFVGNIKATRKGACAALFAVLVTVVVFASTAAGAAQSAVGLGTAGSFAVLGGTGVTNTGPTVVNGDLGTCPTPAITGFPPGIVNGTIHANDSVACGAQADLTIAYNDAAGRAPDVTYAGPTDLGSPTPLLPGVYQSPTSFAITGTLTLDGQGDPDSVFIFQAGSTLITAVNSHVVLINGAQACNVFWQVGSSATLGVGSTFAGTILALTSIAANTNAVVQGRLLARNGSTTLDTNTITATPCATTTTTTGAGATTSTTAVGATTTSTTVPVSTTTSTTAVGATTTSTTAPVSTTTSTTAVGATTTTSTSTTLAPTTTSTSTTVAPSTTTSTSTSLAPTPTPSTSTSTTAPGTTSTTTSATTSTTAGFVAATAGPTAPTPVPLADAFTVTQSTTPGAPASSTVAARAPLRTTSGDLARTGAPMKPATSAAMALVLVGGVMITVARRAPWKA